MRKTGLVTLLICYSIIGFSQADCQRTLDRANAEFSLGHFYAIPSILKGCLDRGFTDEQKGQAYYLLTRTYLYLDKLDSADYTFLEVLKIDPEFEVSEATGTIEMVYLANNFTTSPILSIKAEGGTNFSTPTIVHQYGTENTNASQNLYSPRWGFGAGVGLELHFSNTVSLEFTPSFAMKKYREENVFFREDKLEAIERTLQVDIPAAARYTFKGDQIRPYIYSGGVGHMLFLDQSNPTFANTEGDADTPIEGDDVRLAANRKFTSWSLLFGVGAMYKIGYNYLHLEFQYSPGLTLINKSSKRYSSEVDKSNPVEDNAHYGGDYPFKYPKVDHDFRLNTFKINAGYTIPLYKPRKKDKFTMRSWFEELSRKKEKKEGK